MSETTTVSASDVLCNLKAVVADLECQQKQQLFKQLQQQLQQERKLQKCQQNHQEQNKSPAQPPMFLMIPIEDTKKSDDDKRSHSGHDHENCSSKGSTRGHGKPHNGNKKKRHNDLALELRGIKSRELRAGILYTGCGCLHRDGLQDSCPRSECQGQPECLVKPWAVCPPGLICRARHPESFGIPPNPDALTF